MVSCNMDLNVCVARYVKLYKCGKEIFVNACLLGYPETVAITEVITYVGVHIGKYITTGNSPNLNNTAPVIMIL